MNRLLATAALALALSAPVAAHADGGDHQNVLDECPLNENGQSLLKQAIKTAQYDITSREYMGFHSLGFSNAEFDRPEAEQMIDVAIRAARALSRYQDGQVLPMAQALGLNRFFFDDALACLKRAATVEQREAEEARAAVEKDAQAKAEADRPRIEAEAKAKVEAERAQIEAAAKANVRAQIEDELRAKAKADAKAKAEADARADIEAATQAKDKAAAGAKAAEEARLEAEAVARHEDEVRQARAAEEEAARVKAEKDAQIEADAKAKADEAARIVAAAKAQHEETVKQARANQEAAAKLKAANAVKAKAYMEATEPNSGLGNWTLAQSCNHLDEIRAQRQASDVYEAPLAQAKLTCEILEERGVSKEMVNGSWHYRP